MTLRYHVHPNNRFRVRPTLFLPVRVVKFNCIAQSYSLSYLNYVFKKVKNWLVPDRYRCHRPCLLLFSVLFLLRRQLFLFTQPIVHVQLRPSDTVEQIIIVTSRSRRIIAHLSVTNDNTWQYLNSHATPRFFSIDFNIIFVFTRNNIINPIRLTY